MHVGALCRLLLAAAELTISDTARVVPYPLTRTPPGEVGWPSEISAVAL